MPDNTYTKEELQKLQTIEIEALAVLDHICKTLSIDYFAIGGTALGAVRHGGFIPWDDDVDVGMTRENYNKFIVQAPGLLPSQYHLQDPISDNKSPYPYVKIRVDHTEFTEYANRTLDIHHGVYIDIFPFDEVPDDEELNILQFETVQKLSKLFVLCKSPDISVQPNSIAQWARAILRRSVYYCLHVIPPNMVYSKLLEASTKYNGTNQKAMACLLFPKRKCEYGLKETLFPVGMKAFGPLMIPIPNDYNTYLTSHYGKWRELPPPEKRVGHKPFYVRL